MQTKPQNPIDIDIKKRIKRHLSINPLNFGKQQEYFGRWSYW